MRFLRVFSLVFFLLTISLAAYADMPGNKPRPSRTLIIVNSKAIEGYHFFQGYDVTDENKKRLVDSVGIILPGGRGAPIPVTIFALRLSDSTYTEVTRFYSVHGDQTLQVDSVGKDNKIYFSEVKKKGDLAPAMPFSSTQNPDAENYKWLFAGLSTLALFILLIIWFLRKRSNQLASE